MTDKVTQCVELIENLTAKERKELSDEIKSKVETKTQLNPDTDTDDLISEALDEIAADRVRLSKTKTRNSYLQELKFLQAKRFISEQYADNPLRGIEALIAGNQSKRIGARQSAENAQESLKSIYTDGFLRDLIDADLDAEFKSGMLDQDIFEYVYMKATDEGVPQGKFTKEVSGIGDLIIKWQEVVRLDANDAGSAIKRLAGYLTRQSHDMLKVRNMGKQAWIDEIKPLLDPARMAKEGENPDVYLGKIYDDIASGNFMTEDSAVVSAATVNIGESMSKSRVLHFKDGKAAFEYNKKFGAGNLRESLFNGFDRAANGTGLMRVLGPNPERMVGELVAYSKTLIDASTEEGAERLNKLNKALSRGGKLDNLLNTVNGNANIPANVNLARAGTIARNINTMASLGAAVISALPDLVLFANEYRRNYGSWFKGAGIGFTSLLKGVGLKGKDKKIAASMVGVYSRSMSGILMTRFSGNAEMAGRSTKLTNQFFRANLLGWWTDTLRESFAMTMSHKAALQKGLSFDELDAPAREMMQVMGITAKEWDVVRNSKTIDFQGDELISANAVNDIDDKTMRELLSDEVERIMQKEGGDKEKMIARLLRRRRSEIASKWQGYILDRSEHAVVHGDSKTRAMLQRGTSAGTIEGEFFRAFAQFKSFGVAVLQRGLGSQFADKGIEFDQDAVMKSLWTGFKSNPHQIAQTVMMMTAFGYLSMTAKDVLKGRKPRDLENPKTWRDALLQGGSLGLVGDIMLNPVPSSAGGGFVGFTLGPVGSDFADVFEAARKGVAGEDATRDLTDLFVKNIPGNNLFYVKPMLDYMLMDNVYENISPGYKRRAERRLKEEGIEYLDKTIPEAIFGEK